MFVTDWFVFGAPMYSWDPCTVGKCFLLSSINLFLLYFKVFTMKTHTSALNDESRATGAARPNVKTKMVLTILRPFGSVPHLSKIRLTTGCKRSQPVLRPFETRHDLL
jgi:hypothetical protein